MKALLVLGSASVLALVVAATVPLDRRLASAAARSTTTATAVTATLLASSAFAFVAAWGLTSPFAVSDAALFGVRGPSSLPVAAAAVGWSLVARPRRGAGP